MTIEELLTKWQKEAKKNGSNNPKDITFQIFKGTNCNRYIVMAVNPPVAIHSSFGKTLFGAFREFLSLNRDIKI
jgi:hypothetical protein